MLIIVLPNYSLDDVWDILISFFGAISHPFQKDDTRPPHATC